MLEIVINFFLFIVVVFGLSRLSFDVSKMSPLVLPKRHNYGALIRKEMLNF